MCLIYWWAVPSMIAGVVNYILFPRNLKAEDEDFLRAVFCTVVWPITALCAVAFGIWVILNTVAAQIDRWLANVYQIR